MLFLGADSAANTRSTGALTGTNRPVNRMDWWIATLDDNPPVKTGVHADVLKQGLSVWASSGAGITPEAWEGPENRVIFSASFGNADTFRDAVNVWSIPLSSRRWHAAGPALQITSGSAFESRPAVTASGDVYFSNAETRTGIWRLPLSAKDGKVTGELGRLTKGERLSRPAFRGSRWQQSRVLFDEIGKHGPLGFGSEQRDGVSAYVDSSG